MDSAASVPLATDATTRAALALAEALIPGTALIPGADEGTVRAAAELLAQLSPRLSKAWWAAQRALDAAARLRTGRPFHSLSVPQQERLLALWEQDPVLRLPLSVVSFL